MCMPELALILLTTKTPKVLTTAYIIRAPSNERGGLSVAARRGTTYNPSCCSWKHIREADSPPRVAPSATVGYGENDSSPQDVVPFLSLIPTCTHLSLGFEIRATGVWLSRVALSSVANLSDLFSLISAGCDDCF